MRSSIPLNLLLVALVMTGSVMAQQTTSSTTSTPNSASANGQTLDLTHLEQAAQQNPNDPQAWANLATAAKWAGNTQVEQMALQRQVALQPTIASSASLWSRIGDLLRQQKQSGASVGAYQNALKVNPNLADTWHNLGLSQIDIGKLQDAVTSLNKATALQPALSQYWNDLAGVLTQLKQDAAAAAARINAEKAKAAQAIQSAVKK